MTDRQITHSPDCWSWGPRHYECAVGQIERLQAEVEKLRAEALEESARVCDALSKSGDWARALRLADECEESAQVWANEIDTRKRAAAELRRLHTENEAKDALLREALYALEYASDMTKPEDLQGCGCPICITIAALHERLGKGTEQKA